jgi:hypothetical protein
VANGVDSELLFEDGAVARHMMRRSKRFKRGMIDDGDGWLSLLVAIVNNDTRDERERSKR